MAWNNKKIFYIVGGITIIGLITLAGITFFSKNPKKESTIKTTNFNTVSDSSIGLSFNMSKSFQPIPGEELAAMNPGFTYGFRPSNDKNAICIVSQTPLKGRGTISSTELRDGILNEIKKVHPDVQLVNSATATNPVKFGEGHGVLLELTYIVATGEIKRVEVIAVGNLAQVIAYCQSLSADNSRYYSDFTTFFSSLKLNK